MRSPGRSALVCAVMAAAAGWAWSGWAARVPGDRAVIDLWRETPRLRPAAGTAGDRARQPSGAAWAAGVAYLGPGPAPDPDRPSEEQPPAIRAAWVRTVQQREGSVLAYALRLGESPSFSFRPLRTEQHPRPFRFRVAVDDGGHAPVPVLDVAPDGEGGRFAASTLTTSLERWAGREIALLLEVESLDGRATGDVARDGAAWGSPRVSQHTMAREGVRARAGNVILIGLDTVRADALGAWNASSSTPALDALAAESDVWLDAYSTFNATNPSFASMMTGLYGRGHGVYDFDQRLDDRHTTLAEVFDRAGYDTCAVLSVAHLAHPGAGLRQGFDRVVGTDHQLAAETAVDEAIEWVESRRRPFFLWLHLFDAHTPHTPPQPFAGGEAADQAYGLDPPRRWRAFRAPGELRFDEPALGGHRDLYRGEVAYLDRQLDRLFGVLRERGLLENTVVAVVADHGENLGEHDIHFRHAGLFETTTRVPLMIRWPGLARQGRRLDGLVQTLDLFPTLLDAAGLGGPTSDGIVLGAFGAPDERRSRGVVWSEAAQGNGFRLRGRRFAYMESKGNRFLADGAYLFDLQDDPGETTNLAGTGRLEETWLRETLTSWRGTAAPSTRGAGLTPADASRLRSLGYL